MLLILNGVASTTALKPAAKPQSIPTHVDNSPSAGLTNLSGSEPWNSKSEGFAWIRATPTDLTIGTDQYIIDMNDGSSNPSCGIRIETDDQMRTRYRDDSGNLSSDDLEDNRSVENTLRTYGISWSNAEGKMRLVSGGAHDEHSFTSGTFSDDTWERLYIGSRNGGSQPFTGTYETLEIGNAFLSARALGLRMKHANMFVFIGGGQSLMSGHWSNSADAGDDDGYISFIETADTLYSSAEVVAIEGATGASGLSNLTNGSSYWWHRTNQLPGPAYDTWKAAAYDIGATPSWCLWAQGEADSASIDNGGEITAVQYKADLLAMFKQMRNDLNSELQIGIQGLGRRSSGHSNAGGIQTIREIQQELAAENSWIHMLGYSYDQTLQDDVHLTDGGYASVAERLIRRAATLDGKSVSGSTMGPSISGASRSGTSVSVTISHDGGTDFTPSSGIVGFRFFDNGSEITINSAVRTDATTVTLTLASTPSGIETLYYCYDDASDITNANIGSVLTDNSSEALPLIPDKIIL